MATTSLGGTLIFKINGVQWSLAGTFTYDLGGIERDTRVGPDGVHGSVSKYRAPMMDVELQDGPGVKLSTLTQIDGVTLTAELSNGKTVVLYNAFQVGDLANDVVEAKIKAKFSGTGAREI